MARPKILPSAEYLQACFVYDPSTGELTWRVRPREHFPNEHGWEVFNRVWAGKIAGRISQRGYRTIAIGTQQYYAHRIIWKMLTGEEPPPSIDHRFGETLDNRIERLRAATQSEQGMNSARPAGTASGYRGVYPTSAKAQKVKKWNARIYVNGVQHNLGTFDTLEEAIAARQTAERVHFGVFQRRSPIARPTR